MTTTRSSSAQTVGRAVNLLRLIASSKSRDLRLVDIAEMAGLQKSTAHRLLQRLVDERMLVRDKDARGYQLGPLLHELGLAALPSTTLREAAHPAMVRLTQECGDMAFLVARSGLESVCLDRIAGNFAIQTMTQGIGDRHPLGIGAGGLAILSALSDSEISTVRRAIGPQLRRYRLTQTELMERVARTRERGCAVDEGTAALEVTAIGMAVRDHVGAPAGAIFVASIRSRMADARLREVERQLRICVRSIEGRKLR